MYFIVASCITFLLLNKFKDGLKKNASKVYLITALVGVLLVVSYGMYLNSMNGILHKDFIVLGPLYSGAFTSALFVIVMYLGAFSKPNNFTRKYGVLRTELSILACILTYVHNISMLLYIKCSSHVVGLEFGIEYAFGAITFVLMTLLMLPLFITSFMTFKKKLGGKKWKKIQRLAYPFYALIYLQILLINIPAMMNGSISNTINVIVYSVVFITYFVLKIKKKLYKKSSSN